jgi:hypothetical protein
LGGLLEDGVQYGAASWPWQIEYEGVLCHVFSRGNNQQNIFVTDDDREIK